MFPWLKVGFGDIFQILVLTVAVYYVLNLFRRTRSAQMLYALAGIVLVLAVLAWVANLQVLGWIVMKIVIYVAFALVVIFQPEIRQTLAVIGRGWRTSSHAASSSDRFIDGMVEVASSLSRTRTGALIAIERQINLDAFCENGTMLNAPLVSKLLCAIFFPNAPLHDGGVIIRGETIVAARCVFPLSSREDMGYGMRHRAALGLSEQTDAVVIVVSEETGDISIAYDGRLMSDLTPTHLTRYLKLLMPKEGLTDAVRRAIDQMEMERSPGDASDASFPRIAGQTNAAQMPKMEVRP
jgi:diadenylate cyclase